MEINVVMEGVSGAFDTSTGRLVCVPSPKYAEVELCFAERMNIPFAKIKLHDRDRYVDAKAVFDDAAALGALIAERWNAAIDTAAEARVTDALQKEVDRLNAHIDSLTDVRVTGLTPDAVRGGMVLGLEGGMLQVMAECFAATFKGRGAKNFLSMDFTDSEGESYTVTMQKSGGDTPASKNARLEEEVGRLKAELAERPKITDRSDDISGLADRKSFQQRVKDWLLQCFGEEIANDTVERNHRFLEEALELVQSLGCSKDEACKLVDYVYDRAEGDPAQEVGGVMVTLAALCLANGMDVERASETELARIVQPDVAARIREKQKRKPAFSPLPGSYPDRQQAPHSDDPCPASDGTLSIHVTGPEK